MTEQIKAWAFVSGNGLIHFYNKLDTARIMANGRELIELTSTPKIKMTQAEFDEFNKLKRIRNNETLYIALAETIETIDYPLLGERFYNNNNAQLEFARLWASDNPEELVEIEEEKNYELVFKATYLHQTLIEAGTEYAHIAYSKEDETQYYTQSEIDELGGDDWLAEMGLTKVEVTE